MLTESRSKAQNKRNPQNSKLSSLSITIFEMGPVRKYFCCTDNITGCTIIGGIQLTLSAIFLGIYILAYTQLEQKEAKTIAIVGIVLMGFALLLSILLVVGAATRNFTLLMIWTILNGVSVLVLFIGVILDPTTEMIVGNLIILGFGIWAELVAIGGIQEVKTGARII